MDVAGKGWGSGKARICGEEESKVAGLARLVLEIVEDVG
jgi:hypothetical protein